MGLLLVKILRICLPASFTQYTATITQVQESVSDFNPESSEAHRNEDSASLAVATFGFKKILATPTPLITGAV